MRKKKKPKEESLSDLIDKATKPKVKKLPKGGSVIENEAAYAYARYWI